MNMELDDTGERMIPDHHRGLIGYAEHVQRYEAAVETARGRTVLDIASGSGYGSAMLADSATHVYGVDVSEEAVAYARATYGTPNIEFLVGSGTAIPLPDDSVDLVVTFETIEHIDDYRQFLREIRRVLKPGGLAIISTPNDLEYEEGNHFHLHEFERQELRDELVEHFSHVEEYFQATWKYVALDTADGLAAAASARPTINLAPLAPQQMRYFYFLCSDRPVTETVTASGALGEHYSEKQVMEWHRRIGELESELRAIQQSRSYRLGRRIARIARLGRR